MKKETAYLSSGCLLVDLLAGGEQGKCYRFGYIHNFVGAEASGKTFLALHACQEAFEQYGDKCLIVYDDTERAIVPEFGCSIFSALEDSVDDLQSKDSNIYWISSTTIEEFLDNITKKIPSFVEKKGFEKVVYILDSYDALWSEESKDHGFYLEKTKKLSVFLGNIVQSCAKNNILLIVVSQVREDISSPFRSLRRTGGRALRHGNSFTLMVAVGDKKIKKKAHGTDVIVAKDIKFKIQKSRFFVREGIELSFFINLLTKRIDNEMTNLAYLEKLGVIERTTHGRLVWNNRKMPLFELAQSIRKNNETEALTKKVIETFKQEEQKLIEKYGGVL